MSENVEEPTQAVEADNNDALAEGSLDQDLTCSIPVTLTVELLGQVKTQRPAAFGSGQCARVGYRSRRNAGPQSERHRHRKGRCRDRR